MGDLRLGQKLINHLSFKKGVAREHMQQAIFYMEDDEFQKILDVTIFAPPGSDLRIANYQRLLNVSDYDKKHCGGEGLEQSYKDIKDFIEKTK